MKVCLNIYLTYLFVLEGASYAKLSIVDGQTKIFRISICHSKIDKNLYNLRLVALRRDDKLSQILFGKHLLGAIGVFDLNFTLVGFVFGPGTLTRFLMCHGGI